MSERMNERNIVEQKLLGCENKQNLPPTLTYMFFFIIIVSFYTRHSTHAYNTITS